MTIDDNTGSTWEPRQDASDNVQFGHVNIAANLTDHQINFGGIAQVDGLVGIVMPHSGALSWVSAGLSEAAAGGTVIVSVFKNGVAVASITIAIGATSAYTTWAVFPVPLHTFVPGDSIDVRITTGAGWTATTADIGVCVGYLFGV